MFKKLRDKLKATIAKFSKDVDEEGVEEIIDIPTKESKLGFLKSLITKKGKDIPEIEEEKPKEKEKAPEEEEKEPEEKPKEKEKPPEEEKPKEEEKEPEKPPEEPKEEEKPPEEIETVKLPEEPPKEEIKEPEVVEKPEVKEPEKVAPKVEEKEPEKPPEEEPPEEKVEEKKGAFDFIKKIFPGEKPKEEIKVAPKPEIKEPEIITPKIEKVLEEVEKPPEEEKEEEPVKLTEKEKEFEKIKKEHKEEIKEVLDEVDEQLEAVGEKMEDQRPGFFTRIISKKISEEKFDDLFWELEVILLENNLSVEVIEKIKSDLKDKIVNTPIPRKKILETIENSLRQSILDVISIDGDFFNKIEQERPYVICLLGVNGSGKTTSIAKLAHILQDKGKTVVLAAADTFRAAAIDQLQEHADKLGVKLIKHDYGSDPAAVAFDAIEHAKAKDIDVVLIDTAGRNHSNENLLEEMKKIIRVAKPHMKIFVGESITGNDCIEQAQKFNDAIGLSGIILSKADIDEKGGAAISVSYVTKRPIYFLGVGQGYDDLEEFDKDKILKQIFE